MIDFIKIDESCFTKNKMEVDENDPTIQKVQKLLEKYTCFNDFNSFHSYSKTKHYKNNHSHNNSGGHHHSQQNCKFSHQRKHIVNLTQKGNDRNTNSLLNKLSRRNYETILEKLHHYITFDNVVSFIKNILDKCQKQSCFLELYINLLYDIYHRSSMEIKHVISQVLLEYISEFMDNREFKNYQLDSENYLQFCNNIDNKKQIIGKHKTILSLILKILRNNMIDDYFNSMFNEIKHIDNNYTKEDYERHELLLEIIGDFVRADIKYKSFIEKYYHSNKQILESYSLKARFKVMDITTLNDSIELNHQ
jgi:Mn-dependent DtxR family transcriptional regulator